MRINLAFDVIEHKENTREKLKKTVETHTLIYYTIAIYG